MTKNKGARKLVGDGNVRDRRGQTLFIDARKLGTLVDRTHRELTDVDIQRIADTYHSWRGEKTAREYSNEPGFCRSVASSEILSAPGALLTPGRYVGGTDADEDATGHDIVALAASLTQQASIGRELDSRIEQDLRRLGFIGK